MKVFKIALLITLLTSFASCSKDDSNEPDYPIEPNEPETEFVIKPSVLYGTWELDGSSTKNVHYFSFDKNGKGSYALSAEQFIFPGCRLSDHGFFGFTKFSYNIEGNIIHIIPETAPDFDIRVSSLTTSALDFYCSAIMSGRMHYTYKSSNANWFEEESPQMTTDVTKEIIGEYEGTLSIGGVKNNNVTFKVSKISDFQVEVTTSGVIGINRRTGYISWQDYMYNKKDVSLYSLDMKWQDCSFNLNTSTISMTVGLTSSTEVVTATGKKKK